MNSIPRDNSSDMEIVRQQITLLVDEVAVLSRGDVPPEEFHKETLHRAIRATSAISASLWLTAEDIDGRPLNDLSARTEDEGSESSAWNSESGCPPVYCVCAVSAEQRDSGFAPTSDSIWQRTLATAAMAAGQIQSLSPGTDSNDHRNTNPTNHFVIAAPFQVEGCSYGAMVMTHDESATPAFLQGVAQVVTVLCELVGDYHLKKHLRQLRQREQDGRTLQSFRQELLTVGDLTSLVWSGTNAARRVLQCDRVSLLLRRGRQWQLKCVSGVDTIDRRSTSVSMLERLAEQVTRGHKPIWLNQASAENDSMTAADSGTANGLAETYRQYTNATVLGMIPLTDIGLFVVEQFANTRPLDNSIKMNGAKTASTADETSVQAAESFPLNRDDRKNHGGLQHAAQQIATELTPILSLLHRVDELPLISISRWLNRWGLNRLWNLSPAKWVLLLAVAGLLSVILCWPIDFEVEARGELQPAEQQFLYAPRDGVVIGFPDVIADSDIAVNHADHLHVVEPGQVVVQLENSDLEYQVLRVLGEQQTTSKRLDTVTILLEQLARSANPDRLQFSQLTAEKLELEIRLQSTSQQLEILRTERQTLAIKSAISGEIQTWDFVSKLRSRPVRQGSHLMTIANVAGAWRLELQIPDRSMADIHEAQRELGEELPVRFLIRSAPAEQFTTQLSQLSRTTRVADSHGLAVEAVAELDRTSMPENVRPGTAVVARIYCGRRSLAFVWLHDLARTVRQRLLF